MSLICGAPQTFGGGASRHHGHARVGWEHRPSSVLPFSTTAAATTSASMAPTAASPSSSSESSHDSDDRHAFLSHPASPHDVASYSPHLPSPPPQAPSQTTTGGALTTRRVSTGGKPGRTPSRYDWSKHMPTIKRLYIDEDKTLNQVLDIMKEEHDFVATPRMVKTRLKKWGYSKNVSIKSDEVQELMDKIVEVESRGDVRKTSTEVTLATGKVVTLDRVAAHLRRKKVPSTVLQSKLSQLALLRTSTSPGPSPISLSITSPDVFQLPEGIFFDVRDFVRGQGAFDPVAAKTMVRNVSPELHKVCAIVYSAREFCVDDQLSQAVKTLNAAPKRFKKVIRTNLEAIPRLLFMTVVHLWQVPGPSLQGTVKALIRLIIQMAHEEARVELHREHPLRRILLALSQANEDTLWDLSFQGWKCLVESYDSLQGSSASESAIGAWLDLGGSAGFEALPIAQLEYKLRTNYEAKVASLGESHQDSIWALFWCAELEQRKVKAQGLPTAELERLLHQTLRACEGAVPPDSTVNQEANCHFLLGEIYKTQGDRVRAEYHMRTCIDRCIRHVGPDDPVAARVASVLQGWYQEWQDAEMVAATQQEIEARMATLQTTVDE